MLIPHVYGTKKFYSLELGWGGGSPTPRGGCLVSDASLFFNENNVQTQIIIIIFLNYIYNFNIKRVWVYILLN